jgi:quercetin dioxygenase-like cupin family protein
MLSLIERGDTSATAVTLEKVATALGVPLASLFDDPTAVFDPVSRSEGRAPWRDPDTGYKRWNISPAGYASPLQIVEVEFPPRTRVAYETGPRRPVVHQQIWVLEGSMEITLGDTTYTLHRGDCLAMKLDVPITYRNRSSRTARYVVVIASSDRNLGRR